MTQDILITPGSGEPQILFRGSGTNDTAIELNVLSSYQSATGSGTALVFEGQEGQLFAITDNLSSGVIFSVGDITGLSLLSVDASGDVRVGEFGRYVGIGQGDPQYGLDVFSTGNFRQDIIASGSITADSFIVDGGSSEYFLKGDGSLDNAAYITSGDVNVIISGNVDTQLLAGDNIDFTYDQNNNTLTISTSVLDDSHTHIWDNIIDAKTKATLTELSYLSGVVPGTVSASRVLVVDSNKDISTINNITANSFIVDNGTSSQFLKADGSLDSNTYLTSVGWTDIQGGNRTNYNLAFRPTTNNYAGFTFQTSAGTNGGYFLIRGTSDSDVYTAEGITLVADAGWLTLAQRTASGKGVRLMTGASSVERLKIDDDGDVEFLNGNSFIYNTNELVINSSGDVGIGTASPNSTLHLYSATSGDSIFNVEGTNGSLFSIVDSLSGSLMSVNNIIGLPVFEVFDDDTVIAGRYGENDFYLSTSGNVGFGTSNPEYRIHVSGDAIITDAITAGSFIKNGGTSSQFLKADGSVDSSSYITGNQTITLTGDVSGAGTTSISVTVADDSHNHIISNVDGLQSALDLKAPLASPALTGTPTAPTAASGTNTTQIATTQFVRTEVSNLVASAPSTLDTLNELAAALGDDPNFSTTVTTSLGTKVAGTGTINYVPKFTASQTIQNSQIFDNGTNVGIGTASPTSTLHVNGTFYTDVGNSAEITLFEHTGGSTPVPFNIRKTGFSGNTQTYGILHLDMGHSVVGGGSNLHFRLKNSAGDYVEYGGIGASIDDATSTSEDGSLHLYTTAGGTIRQERLTILNGGNVGIGTTSPNNNLQIGSTTATATSAPVTLSLGGTYSATAGTNPKLKIYQDSSNNSYGFGVSANSLDYMTPVSTNSHNFYIAGSHVVRISGSGLGIGTTSPVAALDVNGNRARFITNTDSSSIYVQQNGTGGLAQFYKTATQQFVIDANANVGIGTSTPSDKLSILAPPNSLVFGAKDTTRNNHIFQLLADDSAGNGELRLYSNSAVGTHTKQVEIASQGSSYFLGGNVGIGTSTPSTKLHVVGDTSVDGNASISGSLTIDNVYIDGNSISSTAGNLVIGDPSSDIYIGDGVNNVDIVFQQDGEVRALTGQTLTVGASGADVALYAEPLVAITGTNNLYVETSTGTLAKSSLSDITSYVSNNLTIEAVVGSGSANYLAQWSDGNTLTYNSTNTISGSYAIVVAGSGNVASGDCSFIGGGTTNQTIGGRSVISGGYANIANGNCSVVSGGDRNCANANCATVGGGQQNRVIAGHGTVAGGCGNVSCSYAAIGGGKANQAQNTYSTVSGGYANCANTACSTVSGGYGNNASGNSATISGGKQNRSTGNCSFVGGGVGNCATQIYSAVVGGVENFSTCNYSFGGNGFRNCTSGPYGVINNGWCNSINSSTSQSTITNGQQNCIATAGSWAFIGNGVSNIISSGVAASVVNGAYNVASGNYSAVVAGSGNIASGGGSFIGAGAVNCATGCNSVIVGGACNCTINGSTIVVGGCGNQATGPYAFIGGGRANQATGDCSFVGGGRSNVTTGADSSVVGGSINCSRGNKSFIGNGTLNITSSAYDVIAGGYSNNTTGYAGFIGGGFSNCVNGCYSVIGGGWTNCANGCVSTVAGGRCNCANGNCSSVVGGASNRVHCFAGFVGGGYTNTVSGDYSNVLGGFSNTTSGNYSSILGGQSNDDGGNTAVFILGTGITATDSNTTYTQKLNASYTLDPSGTIFNVEGSNGSIFSVVDDLSGALMSVNTIAGLPVLQVNADYSIVGGRFNQNDFVVTTSGDIGIGTANPTEKLHVYATGVGEGALIGSSKIGNWESDADYASFTHNDVHSTATSYALLQANNGTTFLNSASSTSLYFRINNVNSMIVDSSRSVRMLGDSTNNTWGSASPTLAIKRSNSAPFMSFHSDGGTRLGYLQFHAFADNVINGENYQDFVFNTNSLERMRIHKDGYVNFSNYLRIDRTNDERGIVFEDSGGTDTIYMTVNDGQGNFNMMLGMDHNGNNVAGDGPAKFMLAGHSTAGCVSMNAGSAGASTYNIGLGLFGDDQTLRIGNPNNNIGIANYSTTVSGVTIADVDGDLITRYLRARDANGIQIGDDSDTLGIFVQDGGNVGIGTSSPTQKLHIDGNIRVGGAYYDSNNSAGTSGQVLSSTATGTDWISLSEIQGVDGTGTTNYVAKWSDADTVTNSQIFDNGTNVGIGTTLPSEKLHVVGDVQIDGAGGTIGGTSYANGWLKIGNSSAGLAIDSNEIYATSDIYLGTLDTTKSIIFRHANTERMRIHTGGNVGIGTTVPSAKLHVVGDSKLDTQGTGGYYQFLAYGNQVGQIRTPYRNSLYQTMHYDAGTANTAEHFFTLDNSTGNNHMLLNNTGLGIGTTSPSYKLDVSSSVNSAAGAIRASNSFIGTGAAGTFIAKADTAEAYFQAHSSGRTSSTLYGIALANHGELRGGANSVGLLIGNGALDTPIILGNNNAERMRIAAGGNVGIGTASPNAVLHAYGSTPSGTVFNVEGTNGSLFSVVDNLSGTLMSVNNNAGLPVFEVFDDDTIVGGRFAQNDFVVTTSGDVGIGTANPVSKLQVNGTVTATSIVKSGGTSSQFLKADGSVDSTAYTTCTGTVTGLTAGTAITVGTGATPSVAVSAACNTAWNAKTTCTGTVTSVGTGAGLNGSITTTGSITLALYELSTSVNDGDGDYFIVVDTANAQRKLTKANINLSGMNNDSGWTSCTGTVTGLTAGTAITVGTGATPSVSVSSTCNTAWNAKTTCTGTVTSVSAGNGLDFTSISTTGSVTLGTPGSITCSSTNSVSATSHTHAFAPGGTTAQYIRGDGTLATLPTYTVNNGTLTMAVSGTGLSGSATFTANQSGNSTFTVTSNATSANTVSTIVARDASGNFSAGTVNTTQLNADNLRLDGNTLSSTNTNGNIVITPNGTGGIAAGVSATVTGSYATVSGGSCNTASGAHSSVSGGYYNINNARYSTINGGHRNVIQNYVGITIGGGVGHNTSGGIFDFATGDITGTITCCNAGEFSTISGGLRNCSTGSYSTIGGGYSNTASSFYSTVGGGYSNSASTYSTVGGGAGNVASGTGSTVAGGGGIDSGSTCGNTASGNYSTISGGKSNCASGYASTVSGGQGNCVSAICYATIGGGYYNEATGAYSTVSGGGSIFAPFLSSCRNTASGYVSTIGGGASNKACGNYSTVSGGGSNTASGNNSTVNGGYLNCASGNYSTLSGGLLNTASGYSSTVSGGSYAKASKYGELSHAAGRFAATGDAQHSTLVARRATSGANNFELFLDGSSQRLVIPAQTTWTFTIKASAYNGTQEVGAWWIFRGGIQADDGGGVELIGSVIEENGKHADFGLHYMSILADASNSALKIQATTANSDAIRWVAVIDITQVSYGTP